MIFKGFGPGPGQGPPTIADLPALGTAAWPTGRALRLASDQIDHLREIVGVMQGKIPGVVRTTSAVPARPSPAPAPAPAPRPAAPPRGVPAPAPAPAPAATEVVTNWGQRCCAKDIAELRAALSLIQRASGGLQNPAALAQLGRRSSATRIGAMAGQISAALDGFANTRDATTAATALGNIARQLDGLARVVAGAQ